MKKLVSIICFAFLAMSVMAQHYPDVFIDAGTDIALPCGSNCTKLTATYQKTGSPIAYIGAAITTFSPYPDTVGVQPPAPFLVSDDVYSGAINIPFKFCFFGNTYQQLVIGNNGMVSFNVAQYAGLYNPWDLRSASGIPSASQQLNSIMGTYMDIIPGELPIADSNFVNYATFGVAPNRKFVVSYHKVPFYSTSYCPGQTLSTQIVLYETSNVIEIYIRNKTSCSAWNNGLAIEGIQNANGTVGYAVPGRNNSVWTTTSDGYRFTPTGSTDVQVDWYQNGTHLASTDTVTVCPPNNRSTSYVATATYFGCDSARTIIADTIQVNVLQSAGPPQYLSCPSPAASITTAATGTGTWLALSTNPTPTVIAAPTSPATLITGFASPGTYRFSWSSGLCADTAYVYVTARANAGPDQNKCKNDTATMAAYGTGTWSALSTNPSITTITTPTLNITTITGFTAGGSYSFVWTTSPGCSDTMVVNIPLFAISAAAASNTVCQYSNTTVTVTPSPAALAPFQYTWLDSNIVQSPHAATTLVNAVPGNTYYHIQVTSSDGCKLTDSVLVSTSSLIGTNIRASATPATVCPGDTSQLIVLANPNSCGLAATACTSPGTIVTVGTGTSVQNGTGFIYPAPYGNYYKSAHHQFIVRASEILSQVASGGQIKSVALDIGTLNGGSTLNNFTVKLACVGADSLNGFIALGSLVQVYSAATYTPIAGWNTHVFTTPYDWDGVSNLVVDICFDNTTNNNINPKMVYTTTAFRSVWCTYGNDPGGECGIIGTQASPTVPTNKLYQRPNLRFNMCITDLTGANLQWTPSTGPNAPVPSTLDTVYARPIATTQYQVALTSGNGCINYSYVTVNVDTSTKLTFNNDTFICSVQPIRLTAALTGAAVNQANVTYTWTASTGTPPPSGTGASFATALVTPSATTLYTVRTTGGGGCSLFDSMRVTLGNGLPIPIVVDSITCSTANNGKIFVNMTQGVAPYHYTWTPVSAAGNVDSAVNLAPGTYTVSVSDAQACGGTATVTLSAPSPLALTIDSTNIKCYNTNIDTLKAIVTGGRQPYTYTWSTAAGSSATVYNVPAGTYTVSAYDNGGCSVTSTVHITQPPLLTSSAVTTNLTGAGTHDGTITLTTNGGGTPAYSYVSAPAVSGLPNATNLDTGIYIITICDANHCCVNDTAHISGPPPILVVPTIVQNLCNGQCNGSISVTASGGVTPYSYLWNTTPANTTSSITNLCAGNYTLIVTDANNISVTNTYLITAPLALGDQIDSTPITCHAAANGTLRDSAYGGTGPYTITWTPGGNNPLTALGPGTYAALVTDANGCAFHDTASISEPLLLASVLDSVYPASCFGFSDGGAFISVTGGVLPYTILWSASASTDTIATDLAAGTSTVSVTDAHGCTTSVSVTITQPQQIIANVTTLPAHCATSRDGSASVIASNGNTPYSYAWDNVPGGGITISNLDSGTHTLTVTDAKGCPTTVPFIIDTQYVLHLSITSTPVTCYAGHDGTATVTAVNGGPVASYLWSDASTVDPAINLSSGEVYVTVTDNVGCIANDSVLVDHPAPVVVSHTFIDPLCTATATGKVAVSATGGSGPYSYTWAGISHPIADTVYALAAGTYIYTVTDSKGCTQADTVTLTDPAQLSLTTEIKTITCANASDGTVTAHVSGGTPGYTYQWSPLAATDSVDGHLAPGTYTIQATDANGCSQTQSVTLTAPPPIVFTYIHTDSASCSYSSDGHIVVNVAGGTPGTPPVYTYTITGQSAQSDSNFNNLAAGTYQISVSDSQHCQLDTSITVFAPLPLDLAVDPLDTLLPLGGSIQLNLLTGGSSAQINSYSWSPAAGLSCIDCPAPVATTYQRQDYTIVVNYGKNCSSTASTTLRVGSGPDTYIPNAFSPNGDGVNDVFTTFGTGLKSVAMIVFDRWGEKVFDSGDSQWASWDGTYKGVQMGTGVYIYTVTLTYLDGKQTVREGSITLIR